MKRSLNWRLPYDKTQPSARRTPFLAWQPGRVAIGSAGVETCERAISLDPDLPGPHIDLGMILLKTDQSQAACEEFQLVVRKHVAEEVPDLEIAIGELRDAAQRKPDDPLIYDTLGLLMGTAGSDSQLVLDQFRKAIQLRPNFAAAHNHLGHGAAADGGRSEGDPGISPSAPVQS